MKRFFASTFAFILTCTLLVGCSGKATSTPTATAVPTATTPTATEVPMALKVNGEGITLTEYQADLARLQKADSDLGSTTSANDQRDRAIENFTDQLLLEQAAIKAGHTVDDATVADRITALEKNLGSADKLTAWETTNGYNDDSFKTALKREIYADWERDQIIDSVPTTADEVHARQILVQEKTNADTIYAQLKAGADFAALAETLDPTTGGDLGWFPQGYLTQSAVEQAAFSLQPGQYSEVIKSDLGYHIIYVIERDANHTLSVDARRTLQQNKLDDWLKTQKAASQIQVLVQ